MEEWKEYKLGEVVNILDYKRVPLSSKERSTRKGNYPYYGAQGIIDYIDDYIFDGTYLLIAEDGENLKSQKQNVAQLASGKYWVNNHAHIVESNGKSDIRYICYLLNMMDLSGYITGSAQPKLNQANLTSISLLLPSLVSQKRVADFLSIFDNKIEVNRRINDNFYFAFFEVMLIWFLTSLRNDNLEQQGQALFEEYVMNPNKPRTQLLSDYALINPTRTIAKGKSARCIDMSSLPTKGTFPSDWIFKEYNGGMKFQNGDTIMAKITPCLENGKMAYINFLDDDEVAFGSTEYIVLSAQEGMCPELLYFLARHDDFVSYAVAHMNGSSGRQRVSGNDIANYVMPEITNETMDVVSEKLHGIIEVIKNNSFESRRLAEIRDTLLPRLMSGELKPEEMNI